MVPPRGAGPRLGLAHSLPLVILALLISTTAANKHCDPTGRFHQKSGRDGYTNPCPIVFAPQPYCFCIASPSYIQCNLDSEGYVVGVTWGSADPTDGVGTSWMENTWDERTRRQVIYRPPTADPEDPTQNLVTTPGTNGVCRQYKGEKDNKVTPVNITFPREWPDPNDGANENRIIGMLARVDGYTGAIASLTFIFDWPDFQAGAANPYFTQTCGYGSSYTETRSFFAKSDPPSDPDYQSVLCGLRAACKAKHKAYVRYRHTSKVTYIVNPRNPNRNNSDMMMPLMACWSEEVRNETRSMYGNDGTDPNARRKRTAPAPSESLEAPSVAPAAAATPAAAAAPVAAAVLRAGVEPVKSVQCGAPGAVSLRPHGFLTAAVAHDRWADMPADAAEAAASAKHAQRARRPAAAAGQQQQQYQVGSGRRRRLLAVDSGADGWEGLASNATAALAASADGGAADASGGLPLEPALAVGRGAGADARPIALHAVNSRVTVYTLDPTTGRPTAAHAPRLLSTFFSTDGFAVGRQSGYRSPFAAFDKASNRFLLAAVSSGDAGAAPSVLWLAASTGADPRKEWRVLALPAPAPGAPRNPCGGAEVAVWESPEIGYDTHGVHVGASLACAPAGGGGGAPGARAERRAWLLSLDKAEFYTEGGDGELAVAFWDVTDVVDGARVRAVTPAAPQSRRDAARPGGGAALAVAVDATPGQSRLVFFAVTDTAKLRGLDASAPDAAPSLCVIARPSGHPFGAAEPSDPAATAVAGELPQPGAEPGDGYLDAGRAWRVQSAALSDGRLYVVTKARGSVGAGGPRPALHVDVWVPLAARGSGGSSSSGTTSSGTTSSGSGSLDPERVGDGALLEADGDGALAFGAVGVPASGKPVAAFAASAPAPGRSLAAPAGWLSAAVARLPADGAAAPPGLARAVRPGAGPLAPPPAAAGLRLFGGRTAADVVGGRAYFAIPYAAAGSPANGGGGAFIAIVDAH